jgi:mannose-6-phosphate isomerase-like protein (cupin superfamily)
MKYLFVVAIAVVSASWMLIAAEPEPATYVGHDKVAELFAKGGAVAKSGDFTATVASRTAAGQVEVHEKETDIFYITSGEATFITGGTMVGGKLSRPAQWLGTDIQGGVTHTLTKGDIITIPAGTPHWFKEVKTPIFYYMVKVIHP